MNWGKGIAIAMVLFMVFIVVMVIGFFSHKVDLESEDYYQREMVYEEEIKMLQNANNLKNKPTITATGSHLTVQFDADLKAENIQLELLRPDNKSLDKTYPIVNTTLFTIPKDELVRGLYNYELSYQKDGKNYLQKDKIYI